MIQEWYRNDTGMLQWTLEFCLRKAPTLKSNTYNPCICTNFSSLPEGRSRIGRPADEGSTTRPSPLVSGLWSFRLLNCIETMIFTEILDRRRFDSHLGLGTFGQRNLYLFYPFIFQSFLLLKPQPYPHRHWSYFAAKNKSFLSFEYLLWFYHCLLKFIVCSKLYLIITFGVPRWGSNPESVGPKFWALPLGHTDCWVRLKVKQLYIANPWIK